MEVDVGQVLNSLPSMVWTVLGNGQVDFVNARWEDYTGLSRSAMGTWRWQDVVEPADLSLLTASLQGGGASSEEMPRRSKARLRSAAGELRRFLVDWSPVRSASGEISKWCAVATDVETLIEEPEPSRPPLDFQLVVDSIPVPVAVTTPTGEVEALNRLTLSYFGLELDELKQWKSSEVVHPDDLEETIQAQWAAHREGSSYNVESRHLRTDGLYRWHNVLGLPLRDGSGNIQRWLHLLIDIEDRKAAELALAASELESRLIVGTIAGMVALFTPDGQLNGSNQQLLDYFQMPLEEVANWATNGITHPEDLEHCIETFTASLRSGEPYDFETRFRRYDGVYRWFQIRGHPVRDDQGKIIRWYGLLTDIDDHRKAVDALRESQSELRLIVNSLPGLIVIINPDGEVEDVNDQALDYAGLDLDEFSRWQTNDIIHPDDRAAAITRFEEALGSDLGYEVEERLRRHDGVYRWFQVRGNPVRESDGSVMRWYFLLTDIDDRRKAVEALRSSESELQLIVNSIPALIIVLRPDGTVENVNDQSLRYFGYDFNEHQGWQTNDIIHPDDRALGVAKFAEAAASGQAYEVVERLRRHDGLYRWFQLRGNPVLDRDGSTVRWYFILNDIDDRKRAEEALANSEREFRHIVNMVAGMIILSTPEGVLDGSNQQLLDYFGITLDEVQDWATNGITHPDDVQVNIETFMGSLKSGEPYDYESRYRRHDGVFRWFQVRGQPLRDGEGNIVRWYGLLTDIDDRKHVEEELRRSQAFLSAGQRISSTGTFSWNVQTDELTFSDEWLRIFEFGEGESITLERIRERIHPDDIGILAQKMAAVREGYGSSEYEIRLLGRSGDVKYIRVIGKVIDHQDGHRESLGAIQDVTQRRLAEEAGDRLRAELARVTGFLSLGQMSAAIAHEVNQPISGILTNASTCLRMLSMDPPDIGTALETARRTIRDGNRATEVITRLRALFSGRPVEFEQLDLHDAVNEVIALSASDQRRNRVTIHTSFTTEIPLVVGDRVQLQQVISNLLRNAMDAVANVRDRLRLVEISTAVDGDGSVKLGVADNGIGLDPDASSRIFEAFYTTKADGMGIGLSVCRSIIENHGGRMWTEPNDGPGVTMYFSMPAGMAEEEMSSASG